MNDETTMAARALYITHPARTEAAQKFHEEFEQVFARFLSSPFPDAFVSGMQSVRAKILRE